MMNEHCWVLIGGWREDLWWGKRVKPSEGAPCSVAFNYNYVLERDEKYKDVVGFIHTHPGMTAHYSSRDDRTMKAWVLSLGKPLVCCIIGTDGLRAWWYLNDEDPPVEYQAKSLRGIVFGVTPEEFFDEKKEDGPTWKGLNTGPMPPSLELNQLVKVKNGKHRGKRGKVIFYRTEGNGGMITLSPLSLDNGEIIYVDQEDIDFKFESVSIVVMMDEDTRAEFLARVKEIKENMDEEYR